MATFDEDVQKIIDDRIRTAPVNPADLCCGQIEKAFRDVQAWRQMPGNSLDEKMVAVEHYLFARWSVCTGFLSVAQMSAITVGYDAQKLIDKIRGNPNKQQVTPNPVSPPSARAVKWGLAGAKAGNADHSRCNASVVPPSWRPLDEILPGAGRTIAGKKY